MFTFRWLIEMKDSFLCNQNDVVFNRKIVGKKRKGFHLEYIVMNIWWYTGNNWLCIYCLKYVFKLISQKNDFHWNKFCNIFVNINFFQDMNNWVTGWMDWNMAVDLQGGPTFISNFCDSPILVNASAQEFLKQPMYYAIGHFSKFVPRGSRRIYTSISDGDAPHVAFRRPDGGVVLVILNRYVF